MAAGGPEREDETLRTAFKKLRVDADSALGGGPETPRVAARDAAAPKSKHGGTKDNRHGCVRKTSRGPSRTQRRRRSKSPILHPPRFTFSTMPPPAGALQHHTELGPPSPAGFGAPCARVTPVGGAPRDLPAAASPSDLPGKDEEGSGSVRERDSGDFGVLSKRHGGGPCTCPPPDGDTDGRDKASGAAAPCGCAFKVGAWGGAAAYSFTGLRDVISECERRGRAPPARTSGAALSPASPRSCSSQALVSVDDVTMDDLAGYMEFYLYIPKKMSHMAEMMYT
ncbi:oxidative stress-responsive serine-rich protein 1 [Phycodurus eques]|uniref:oxidative stress-responsive serine-rich protein 1 n=1 Tax=Phycodurus eques TaxID=693459 RepID=UPI002ACDDDF3|nr:oxidative stress-responsive serine-rich protein 1 [Phycodurus eques]XP_061543126.1 oxidative stress-responsive serine-rich protein 1 [Phycodurus eques]